MAAPERFMPYPEVDAPEAPINNAAGLLSLSARPATTDNQWLAGYQYLPKRPGNTVRTRSLYDLTDVGENFGAGENPALVRTYPITLEATKLKSSFNFQEGGYDEVRQLLEDTTSTLLEHELWTGEIAQAAELPNKYLTDPDITLGDTDGVPIRQAVGILVNALQRIGMGTVMVHMPKRLALTLPDRWKNSELLEEHGFVVVSGAGYPYPSDAEDVPVIYATELCNVRLTDIEELGNGAGNINTSTNEIQYTAQRIGAVDFAGPVLACKVAV